jgi:phosphoribosylformylglycinamidine synthase
MSLLPPTDLETTTKRLNLPQNPVEEGCFLNLWSEYRSSSKHLRTFPLDDERVVSRSGIEVDWKKTTSTVGIVKLWR